MNYRHAFHAGNFADVMKHVALVDVLTYLKQKEKPFRVLDTHAGRGRYRLDSPEAQRAGETAHGIDAVMQARGPEMPPALLQYLDVIAAERAEFGATSYPGSPAITARLLRTDDRLVACETHPSDAQALKKAFAKDRRVRVLTTDGWTAVKAELPPPTRRGVVLIDPPFEREDDHARLVEALIVGRQRFATGTYLLWYPIKARGRHRDFLKRVGKTGAPDLWACELRVWDDRDPDRLNGAGLIVCNPPYGFLDRYRAALAFLAEACGRDRHARADIIDLTT